MESLNLKYAFDIKGVWYAVARLDEPYIVNGKSIDTGNWVVIRGDQRRVYSDKEFNASFWLVDEV